MFHVKKTAKVSNLFAIARNFTLLLNFSNLLDFLLVDATMRGHQRKRLPDTGLNPFLKKLYHFLHSYGITFPFYRLFIVTLQVIIVCTSGHPIQAPSNRNYATHSDEASSCIKKSQTEFASLRKSTKIIVNDRPVIFNGFYGKSSYVVKLSVSKTSVSLPLLGINYQNLLRLDASYNGLEKIDEIGNETFPSLRLFNLSHNALTSIHSYVFSNLHEVEIVDLSFNCFVKFQYDQFFLRHENLKQLYLNNNRLHSVQSTFSEPRIKTLDFLDLSNNFIDYFSNFDLQINHLNLRNNAIKRLTILHAAGMTLDVANNKLVHIFAPQGTFKLLNLSRNNIEFLAFVELEEAHVLDLSHNNIKGWTTQDDSYSFESSEPADSDEVIYQLKTSVRKLIGIRTDVLDLSFNKIESIQGISHFKTVKKLNLQNNSLESISPLQFVSTFPMLQQVNVISNFLTDVDIKKIKAFNSNHSEKFQLKFNYEVTTPAPQLPSAIPLVMPPALRPFFIPTLVPPIVRATMRKVVERPTATTTRSLTTPLTQPSTELESLTGTTEKTIHAPIKGSDVAPDEVLSSKLSHSAAPMFAFAFVCMAIILSTITCMSLKRMQTARIVYRNFNHAEEVGF